MPPAGGVRTSLVSYNWGSPGRLAGGQDEVARFATVFDTGGIFSPGQPLVPPDRERLRVWDFPVGVNFIYTPRAYEPIGFGELRALAESHDITRLAIETRKDQIESLEWRIRPRNGRAADRDAAARIAALTRFWQRPDGEQPFATWLREALEDMLVLDAPTFEIRRNRGGDIIGLDVVDGATIKVLVDDTGRRPRPPAPAYEQVIHGRPWRLLTSDELLYAPRNVRPQKAYGYGPVEQIVTTVNIALRRQIMQLQHFTEGNVPPGLLSAPDGWNAEQIKQFQEWFDAMLAGNTAERSKLLWGPSGTRYQAFKEAPYKDDFDEWLARIVCYAFSLPPTAFTRQVNRATAETSQDAALTEGLAPLMGWVKRLCDGVIQDRMGHADLEFAWSDVQTIDPKEQADILQAYVKEGIKTRNEARAILGDSPLPGGDVLTVDTPQGPLKLADAPRPAPVAKYGYDPAEARVPAGNPDGGQWTSDGGGSGDPVDDEFQVAARGDIPCQGYCQSGGSHGTAAMYRILGRDVCRNCAVKMMGLEDLTGSEQTKELERYLIGK
jgi:HK97 family phage portal protein